MGIFSGEIMVVNTNRLHQIQNSEFYSQELETIKALPDGQDYYDYVVNNVELDRSNPKNSYYMFAYGKVDMIDQTKPCLFTEAASSLPDIDTDFPTDKREDAIEYVRNKYGHDKVCQIATFGRLRGRSALKAVMRAEGGYDFSTMNAVTEFIPDEAAISDQLEEMGIESIIMWSLLNDERLRDFAYLDEQGVLQGEHKAVFEKALKLEGILQSQGKHAAGVIISSETISDICPMIMSKSGEPMASLDMGDLEKFGLVKFDFLGVDVLNKLAAAYGPEIVNVSLLDDETWEMIGEGRTKGCFQIESYLGRHWSKELKPENMDHLSALISIVRPGVLNSRISDGRNITKLFCDRKNHVEELDTNDSLYKITKETQNCIIYQETLIFIAKEIAGFNMADALKLMKGVGKKLPQLIASLKQQFLEGCAKVGIVNSDQADAIFNQIEKSSRYLFNKSICPNSIITTKDTTKTIYELEINEYINTPSGYAKVVNKHDHGMLDTYRVTLQNGKTIECSINHKFLCSDGSIAPLWEIVKKNKEIVVE